MSEDRVQFLKDVKETNFDDSNVLVLGEDIETQCLQNEVTGNRIVVITAEGMTDAGDKQKVSIVIPGVHRAIDYLLNTAQYLNSKASEKSDERATNEDESTNSNGSNGDSEAQQS